MKGFRLPTFHYNCFQILASHHGPETRAACCSTHVINYAREPNKVFARRSDGRNSCSLVLPLENFFRFASLEAPKGTCIMNLCLAIYKRQIYWFGRLSSYDDPIVPRCGKLICPEASSVAVTETSGLRRFGDYSMSTRSCNSCPLQRTSGKDQDVAGS